jgi:hypothetical protein
MHAHKKGSNYPPLKEESYALGLSVDFLFPIKTGFYTVGNAFMLMKYQTH